MKALLLFIFLSFFQISSSQKGAECDILRQMLESPNVEVFKFQFVEDLNRPIIIVDTARFFETCSIEKKGKLGAFKVVHDAKYFNENGNEILIVYVTSKSKQNYHIGLYSRNSHGICSADIKVKRGKLFWSKIKCGTLD